MSCVIALFVVLAVIILIMIIGGCCAYSKDIDTFVNTMYDEWKDSLGKMKLSHGIGEPNGILKVGVTEEECRSNQNLLVQSNVSFRPHKIGEKKCMYVQKNWPVA